MALVGGGSSGRGDSWRPRLSGRRSVSRDGHLEMRRMSHFAEGGAAGHNQICTHRQRDRANFDATMKSSMTGAKLCEIRDPAGHPVIVMADNGQGDLDDQ